MFSVCLGGWKKQQKTTQTQEKGKRRIWNRGRERKEEEEITDQEIRTCGWSRGFPGWGGASKHWGRRLRGTLELHLTNQGLTSTLTVCRHQVIVPFHICFAVPNLLIFDNSLFFRLHTLGDHIGLLYPIFQNEHQYFKSVRWVVTDRQILPAALDSPDQIPPLLSPKTNSLHRNQNASQTLNDWTQHH